MTDQRGLTHLLVLAAIVGILFFLLFSNTLNFKSGLFSTLFPKPPSHASTVGAAFVDTNGNIITQTTSTKVNVQLTAPWPSTTGMLSHQQRMALRYPRQNNPAVAGATSAVIYGDSLINGWTNGSFGASVNFSNTSPVYSGTKSIKFKANSGWSGLEFNAPAIFSTSGFDSIQFAVYATKSNQNLSVYAEDNNFKSLGNNVPLSNYGGYPAVNKWEIYTIPLNDIGAGNQTLGDITIQNNTNKSQPAVYVDQVQLISGSNATPTPTSTPIPTSTPTAAPSTTPVPTITSSAVMAEDASFTVNVQTISPYPSNPDTIPYTFSNSTLGTKTLYVKFTSNTGQSQTYSSSIQLVAPATPTPTATPIPTPSSTPVSGGSMGGLHVVGDKILNGSNQQVQLHGVNFSSFEYGCLSSYFNDGPQPPTQSEVNGMKSWHINTVRVVLNEDCWLGINGVKAAYSGPNYINAVSNFVNLLTSNNIAVIINLHFNAPGTHLAKEQEPMADRDHSDTFWSSVANTFKNNNAILFEPYNEPHLNDVTVTNGTPWGCWRDGGCIVTGSQSGEGQFTVAGMQEMVTAIRNTGATNPIIVTGDDWGSDISGWVQYKPSDPLNQLIAGWHSYGDGLSCQNLTCWNLTLASVLSTAPIVTTELGEFDCKHTYIDQVMSWLDSHDSQGYLAWTWGNFNCSQDPALLLGTDTNFSGSPSQSYGQGYHDHLLTRP